MNSLEARPKLSVVVVCFEMAAQVKNTLRSLLPPYQRGVEMSDYEIILIDNGSAKILDDEARTISPNLQYIYLPPNESNPNPALAMNRAAALARAPLLCVMIDGARMLTPGVLSWGIRLLDLAPGAIVEVRGWHLGPKWQPESITEGYDHETETELLEEVRWWENGYRLWEIAAATPQTRFGFWARTAESNCIFMSRDLFPGSVDLTSVLERVGVAWLIWISFLVRWRRLILFLRCWAKALFTKFMAEQRRGWPSLALRKPNPLARGKRNARPHPCPRLSVHSGGTLAARVRALALAKHDCLDVEE